MSRVLAEACPRANAVSSKPDLCKVSRWCVNGVCFYLDVEALILCNHVLRCFLDVWLCCGLYSLKISFKTAVFPKENAYFVWASLNLSALQTSVKLCNHRGFSTLGEILQEGNTQNAEFSFVDQCTLWVIFNKRALLFLRSDSLLHLKKCRRSYKNLSRSMRWTGCS